MAEVSESDRYVVIVTLLILALRPILLSKGHFVLIFCLRGEEEFRNLLTKKIFVRSKHGSYIQVYKAHAALLQIIYVCGCKTYLLFYSRCVEA
mgnify:CR=1 FL=1